MLCNSEENAADHKRDRTRTSECWLPDQRSCEDDDAVTPIVTSAFIQDVPIAPFFPEGSLFVRNALALVIGAAVLILAGGWRRRT